MAFVATISVEMAETITGQTWLRVQAQETVQLPGPINPTTGDLFVAVLERMIEEARGKSTEQARQMVNQNP